MKSKVPATRQPLAKGQLWKTEIAYVQIVELGKRLIHYKLLHSLHQRGAAVRLAGIETVREFLKANRARLVKA